MQVINNNWLNYFLEQLEQTQKLCLVSPFINNSMVTHLLKNWKGEEIRVITRFNLNDFKNGASSLSALERLVKEGIGVKGISELHSKLYLFDNKCAIITSANFTTGGFFNNHELGVLLHELDKISETNFYVESLWSLSNQVLTLEEINEWKAIISKSKGEITTDNILPDFGVSPIKKVIGTKKYFVKFYGTSTYRADLKHSVKEQVEDSHCHFAITFPDGKGRPRRYNDGDIVYMAYLLHENDYAIFGKAICRKHIDNRDIASGEDIEWVEWKEDYPIYIRVHSGEFLNTVFGKCPKLKTLMFELGAESFKSSQNRLLRGQFDYKPQYSLRQQADIELSEEGAFWIETEFQKAKEKFSLLPQSFINSLYQGNPLVK